MKLRRPAVLVAACILVLTLVSLSRVHAQPLPVGGLPGEVIYPSGVSSLLFGDNETYDYQTSNLETSTVGQQTMKANGFQLMRSWFAQNNLGLGGGTTTDAMLLARFQAIKNIGAVCLGVLPGPNTLSFNEHVLTLAETAVPGFDCDLWEFHNEPTQNAALMQDWNTQIPALRRLFPDDRFIGPVTSGPYLSQIQTFLTTGFGGVPLVSAAIPDAISFHDYPCYQVTDPATCDSNVAQVGPFIDSVHTVIRQALGHDLPVGITEWNVDPSFVPDAQALTVSPTYQPRFVAEMFTQFEQHGLDFSNNFDAMSGAGLGCCNGLDLLHPDGSGQPWISAYLTAQQNAANGGVPSPSPSATMTATPTASPLPSPSPTSTSTPIPPTPTPSPSPTPLPTIIVISGVKCTVQLPTGTIVAGICTGAFQQ